MGKFIRRFENVHYSSELKVFYKFCSQILEMKKLHSVKRNVGERCRIVGKLEYCQKLVILVTLDF